MKYFTKTLFIIVMLIYCQHSMAIDELYCDEFITDASATYPSVLNRLKQLYQNMDISNSIDKWQHIATIVLLISCIVSLFGAILVFLQSRNGRVLTILTAVLGVCLVLLNTIRETLPGGTYLNYQSFINEAEMIKTDLDGSFPRTGNDLVVEKGTLRLVCREINVLTTLKKTYPTNIPVIFNKVISDAAAADIDPPDWWINANGIKASGTGSSRIEAKAVAEKQGLMEIQKNIRSKVDLRLNKPIFRSIKQGIMDASMLAVQKKSESFEGSNPISYRAVYQVDNSFIDDMINTISFPLIIFKTDSIDPMISELSKELSDYGFNVTEQPAPRGPTRETNAIFVGSGVPIDAIKKIVELLVKANVPIKAIIYPWTFQKSNLAEKQKFNLVQIGGTKMLESSLNFSKESLEKLETIASQDEMVSFCKESTEALKRSWGLK